MLNCGLKIKEEAQKMIDFAKMHGSGEGDEGEQDLKEGEDVEGEDTNYSESNDSGKSGPPLNKGKNAAIIVALQKKFKK